MKARFPHPGEVFEDKYTVESILGSGGFARVYRATEIGLDRKVALKILRPRIDDEQSDSQRDSYLETVMSRFRREARLLSQLRSPNTITMHHYGKTEEGLLYMVLEYIDGLSLAELMRAGKPLPPKRVATILEQVLNSLNEAHMLGMLHRDLKPANIMIFEHLGNRDNVKLLDFGIAKLVKDANIDKDLTGDGTLVGTPRYMAPEQIRAEADVGPAADVYALGLVAYELLVGERAIEVDSSIKIIGRQLSPESFFLPLDIDCPPRVRHLVDKMLQKDLELRFETAQQVINALRDPDLLNTEMVELELDFAPLDGVDEILADARLEDEFEEIDVDDPSFEELDSGPNDPYASNADPSADDLFSGSTTHGLAGDESIDTSFSGLTGDRKRPVILAGVVFLAIVVALLGIVFFGGDTKESAHAEPPVAKADPTNGGDNELSAREVDATTEDEGAMQFGADEIPEPTFTTTVVSNMDGTEIFVDGEEVGTAPVELEADRFPARIEARHKGRTQSFKIPSSTGGELEFHFDEYKKPKKAATKPSAKKNKKNKYEAIPY